VEVMPGCAQAFLYSHDTRASKQYRARWLRAAWKRCDEQAQVRNNAMLIMVEAIMTADTLHM